MTRTISRRSLLLLALDLNAILAAYIFAYYFRSGFQSFDIIRFPFMYLSFLVLPFMFYVFDLYYPYKAFSKSRTFIDALFSVSIGSLILAAISFLDRTFILPRSIFGYTFLMLVPFIYGIRVIYDAFFASKLLNKKTLVIGTGPLAVEIVKIIKEVPHSGMELVGLVSTGLKQPAPKKNGIPVVGNLAKLVSLIDWYNAELVIVAQDPDENISEMKILSDLLGKKVMVTSAIHLFEQLKGEIPYRLLGAHYILGLIARIKMQPYLKLKRAIDLLFGGLLLIALGPLMLISAGLTAFTMRSNPFFFQKRIGRDGHPFELVKLKTMMEIKRQKPKVTGLGQWIRRYRIDEIPQLINVVKGDMSLIGPRPEIPYFVERSRKKTPFYDAVFTVKPGLTGWAQVMFRHAISVRDYEQKFRYNLYYLKNFSLALDLQILLKTIRVVLLGKGK